MMIKSCFCIILIALCSSEKTVADVPDASPPTQYTITHEATFDIVIKENAHTDEIISHGRIVIGLFGEIVPMTVLNFVTITNGIIRTNVRVGEDHWFIYLGFRFRRILHTIIFHFIVL